MDPAILILIRFLCSRCPLHCMQRIMYPVQRVRKDLRESRVLLDLKGLKGRRVIPVLSEQLVLLGLRVK